jgi:peroxiredoxin
MRASKLWATGAVSAAALVIGYAGVSTGLFGLANAAEPAKTDAQLLRVDNFQLADQNFDAHELYRLKDAKAVVIFTQMNGCPIVRNTAAAYKQLRDEYKGKGVEFFMLNSSLADRREAVVAEAKEWGFADIPILLDPQQLVGEQLGVTRTAEIIVINPKTWQVAYRGPIDDRVVYERQKAKADETWGKDALDALLNGKPIKVAEQQVLGCIVDFPQRDKAQTFAKISYAKQIAPIVEEKCVACHQPGGIGPMQLTSYEKIKAFAPMIRETIRTGRMPPFHADPTVGKFHDDKSLSAEQKQTLVHWIEAGAPRGSGADPLAKKKFAAAEWPLGKPDLILKIPAYTIPAAGVVDYQRPWVENPLTEGRWLRASTIKVGARAGVHHILTGYMAEKPKPGEQANESKWGVSVGGYAVGAESSIMPKDVGAFVPPGGAIGFQNHYTPFGKEAVDNSEIALYFYPKDKNPKMVMHGAVILDPSISIPAGEERHREIAYMTFPKEALLYSAFPHAHYRGQSSDLKIRYPDGTEKMLLSLPKYDFNWQRAYEFAEPVKIPAGSKLIATYSYNNSPRNPANPDPKRVVPWGDQSFDEMFFTALRYRWVDETSDKRVAYDDEMKQGQVFGIFDDNIDGKIQLSELKGAMGNQLKVAFKMIDANGDGGIEPKELASAQAALGRRAEISAPPTN